MVAVGESVVATWREPTASGKCGLSYELSVYVNNQWINNATSQDTSYVITDGLKSCATVRFELTTVSDNGLQSQLVTTELDTGELMINSEQCLNFNLIIHLQASMKFLA